MQNLKCKIAIQNSKLFYLTFNFLLALLSFNFLLLTSVYAQTPCPNPEECAIYNLNQNRLPEGAIPTPPPSTDTSNPIANFLSKITSLVSSKLGELFYHQPGDKSKTFLESGSVQQSELPPELKPNPSVSAEAQLKGNLGGSSGYYGAELPQVEPDQNGVGVSEKFYEQANFPVGIHPVTGQ